MTTNSPNPVDGDVQALIERINVALKQFTSGRASMHVPPLDTDVDIVLADCEKMLKSIIDPPAQLLRPVELPQGRLMQVAFETDPVNSDMYLCISRDAAVRAIREAGGEVKS